MIFPVVYVCVTRPSLNEKVADTFDIVYGNLFVVDVTIATLVNILSEVMILKEVMIWSPVNSPHRGQ